MDAQALFLEWRWIGPCLIGAIVCGAPVEVQSDPGHPAPATVKVLADVVPEVVGDAIGGTATSTHLLPGYGVGDAARSVLDLAAPSPSDLAEVLGAKEDIVTTSRSRIQQIDREIPRVLAEYESGRTTLTLRPEDATAYEERITRLLVSRDGLIRNWLPDLESTLPQGRCSGADCRAREMLRAVEQRVLATQESRNQRMNSAMDRLKAQHQQAAVHEVSVSSARDQDIANTAALTQARAQSYLLNQPRTRIDTRSNSSGQHTDYSFDVPSTSFGASGSGPLQRNTVPSSLPPLKCHRAFDGKCMVK